MSNRKMTQQQIDEKYPLWKCEERPYHEWKPEEKYSMSAYIFAVSPTQQGEHREYLFSADIDRAPTICKNLNQASREWQPEFNTIGALIN